MRTEWGREKRKRDLGIDVMNVTVYHKKLPEIRGEENGRGGGGGGGTSRNEEEIKSVREREGRGERLEKKETERREEGRTRNRAH